MNTTINSISVVIPLKKGGSKHSDIELQYCLRSIDKHLKGVKNVVIVSDYLPGWLNPDSVLHIHCKDNPKEGFKQQNIKAKILAAFQHDDVTETIFFMNDDHYLLQDTEVDQFPYYYCGDLKDVSEKGARPLIQQLQEQGLKTMNADIHTPIIYRRILFKYMNELFTPECIIKSAYVNYWFSESTHPVELKDLKINSNLRYERIIQEIKGRPCFSIGNYGVNHHMVRLWKELYPKASKYELAGKSKMVA